MITLNLISSKRKASKKRNYFMIGFYSVFGLFTLYFLYQAFFVAINLYTTGRKLNDVRKETKQVSAEILRDNDKLNRFILSKFILSEIGQLRKSQFNYKQYLDEIVSMAPQGNDLATVGFENKGFINVVVRSAGDNSFHAFENNLRTRDLKGTDFTSIFSDSVFRDGTSQYNSTLVFKIKTK